MPDLLLVTLDTTRADAMGYDVPTVGHDQAPTPRLDALAASGVAFTQAYTTAPMTLPAHTSMLTGLYPSEHGIHENARTLDPSHTLLAARLKEKGYRTAAFVSGLPLSSQFGLSRGFEHYDDDFGEGIAERSAAETTERALAWLGGSGGGDPLERAPIFLWVHYFDPHEPYDPPEPWRSRVADPYLAEIAAMDSELGRLVERFVERDGEHRFLIVGDHGEGRGDHGEALHGNLLYQGVMRVPMVAGGAGVQAGRIVQRPVSVRRVFDTLQGWAGGGSEFDLLDPAAETVLGEAMKPHLQYGWQPQVMAVRDSLKVIRAGTDEIYDPLTDPGEMHDLAGEREEPLPSELLDPLEKYPVPVKATLTQGDDLDTETRAQLAALGYVDWGGAAVPRANPPAPRDMTALFGDLDRGSGWFVRGDYEKAIEPFERVAAQDPENLMVWVRLGVAHSLLGHEPRASEYLERARRLAPGSLDVRHYLAMHLLRFERDEEAAALLESVLQGMPNRLPALQGLARVRERQGRIEEASALLERIVAITPDSAPSQLRLGELRMALGDTAGALSAFEQAQMLQGERFSHDLELGVLYLAAGDPARARESLDRVPTSHPGYPMALFKRAQVSVLLDEPDKQRRIRDALEGADETTRVLIRNERLFEGLGSP